MIDHRCLGMIVLVGSLGSIALAAGPSSQNAGPAEAALENPLAAHALDDLAATRIRPLFSPGRRPPPPPPVLVARPSEPAAPVPPPSVVLFGIVTDDGGPRAMLRGGSSGKLIRARLGDEVEGWKVTRIESRRLELSHDDRSVTMLLFAGSKAGDAGRVELALPADTAAGRTQGLTDRRSSRR